MTSVSQSPAEFIDDNAHLLYWILNKRVPKGHDHDETVQNLACHVTEQFLDKAGSSDRSNWRNLLASFASRLSGRGRTRPGFHTTRSPGYIDALDRRGFEHLPVHGTDAERKVFKDLATRPYHPDPDWRVGNGYKIRCGESSADTPIQDVADERPPAPAPDAEAIANLLIKALPERCKAAVMATLEGNGDKVKDIAESIGLSECTYRRRMAEARTVLGPYAKAVFAAV